MWYNKIEHDNDKARRLPDTVITLYLIVNNVVGRSVNARDTYIYKVNN